MKLTTTPTELAPVTAATDTDSGVADLTTVAPSGDGQQVLELLAGSYVTVVVVIVIILVLVLGLVVFKSYTTWVSTRTTPSRRRRHSSQHWLTEDNPEMWTDESFGDGELTVTTGWSKKTRPLYIFPNI